jgi:hypothetical protein
MTNKFDADIRAMMSLLARAQSAILLRSACEAFEINSESYTIAMMQGNVQDALAHAWISWRSDARCPACGRSQDDSRFMPADCSRGACLAPLYGFDLLPQSVIE